jgi:hypothetical protein
MQIIPGRKYIQTPLLSIIIYSRDMKRFKYIPIYATGQFWGLAPLQRLSTKSSCSFTMSPQATHHSSTFQAYIHTLS